MQNHFKQLSSPSSTLKSDNQSEFSADFNKLAMKLPFKRFTRSNSTSRSKSKEQSREKTPSNFFVKNICNQTLVKPKCDDVSSRSTIIDVKNPQHKKRQRTPSKKHSEIIKIQANNKQFENAQIELEWVKLEQKYQQSELQKEKLFIKNKQIQQKLALTQKKLTEVLNKFNESLDKLKAYEIQPKQKKNNLAKLKREIAKQKEIDYNPSQVMERQLQIANSQILILKQSLTTSQKLRQETQKSSQRLVGQRQASLQRLIDQLKNQLHSKEIILQKMKIQLNIFQIRQLKQVDLDQSNKCEQILSLKRKYALILKKYHQINQQLFVYKRRQLRYNSFFSEELPSSRGSSLSLSP